MINKYLTNNPTYENKELLEQNMNNYYDRKKKKYMKRKKAENNLNYKTNIYNDIKIFHKLMDNMDYNQQNKEKKEKKEKKDINEVIKIKEITSNAKKEIDRTINAINKLNKNINTINYNNDIKAERLAIKTSSTLFENPYLKYGKKNAKQKKENNKIKNTKQTLNLNSRNLNGFFTDNYEKVKFPKSFKEDYLNKIRNNENNENIDFTNNETFSYVDYKKYMANKNEKNQINFNGILSDNAKYTNYFWEKYGKNIK